MKLKKIKNILIFAICLMSLFIVGCGKKGEKGPSKKFMTFAAPPSSSNFYPYWVAVGKAIQETYPEYQITISESQGAVDITNRIRSGESILGNGNTNVDFDNYNGKGVYEGKGNPEARVLWYFDKNPIQILVSKDSGVKTLEELNGKRFNAGGTGTSTSVLTEKMMEILDIKPEYFNAGQSDAGDAVTNKQIAGIAKTGSLPDSFVMKIGATVPIEILSFTDDQIKKIIKEIPYLVPVTIEAGVYSNINHEVKTLQLMNGAQSTTALSQEDGYKMLKAMNEGGKKIWQASYPQGKDNNILELSLLSATPLHAGTVQYLEEQGYEVPGNIIPKEYQR